MMLVFARACLLLAAGLAGAGIVTSVAGAVTGDARRWIGGCMIVQPKEDPCAS